MTKPRSTSVSYPFSANLRLILPLGSNFTVIEPFVVEDIWV